MVKKLLKSTPILLFSASVGAWNCTPRVNGKLCLGQAPGNEHLSECAYYADGSLDYCRPHEPAIVYDLTSLGPHVADPRKVCWLMHGSLVCVKFPAS